MSAMDIEAERERVRQEIEELERSLGSKVLDTDVDISDSSLESSSDYGEDELEDDSDTDIHTEMEEDPDGGNNTVDGNAVTSLPQTPETCLQMNLVYQEVIQEKIEEVTLLLAQNREQQEKITQKLAGKQEVKSGDGKLVQTNMFLGHFLKPYFKDITSGFGPPANPDTREKNMQGIKSFEELITIKWKSREKILLRESVISDRLQRLLQPKLIKLEYLNNKLESAKNEMDRQILEKQIQETENEISDINQLPEEDLLGNKEDEHDWDKIANINFEGTRSASELRKYWQNSEHPSINKENWSEEEINLLKEIASRHGFADWQAIAQELGTQRSAFQCLQKFQAYNKDFKKREWTPEEDQMLLQLVQEMRVGEHIPYQKIAYYMEGRDSAQLIYRWTQRVDPNLKRGAWTPEEDALLLKAVSKYGERDWFKFRAEVPGRSANQCRDRYMYALHYNIKKGRWSKEEERKLIELTEKYGVGHWAQIASQLPHRSGTQCLSKWKVLLGSNRKRKKLVAISGSKKTQSSSSEESDLDLDLGEASEEEEEESKTCRRVKDTRQWQVPSIDLWIPTRKSLSAPQTKELASVTLLSKGFDENRNQKSRPGAVVERERHQGTDGLVRTLPLAPDGRMERLGEGDRKQSSGSTKDSWKVSLAYVKSVLRRNCYELQRRSREISRKKRFASYTHGRVLPPRESYRGQKDGLWKTTLYRRLMMAVAPWAGPMVQAWALHVKAEASRKSKVEFISRQLQGARLTSTPFFTLFIQLFHIDVNGCMKVIHKRKPRNLDMMLKVVVVENEKASPVQKPPAPSSSQSSSLPPSKKLIPLKAKEGPNVPAFPWKNFLPPYPPPKPKTVSELLREKRQLEAKARRLEQRKVLLAPQLLLPPSVIIQQPPVPLCQAGSSSQAAEQVGLPAGPLLSPEATPPSTLPSTRSHAPSLEENTGGSEGKGLVKESEKDPAECKRLENGLPEKGQDAPGMATNVPSELPPSVTAAKSSLPVASPNSALGVSGATRENTPSAPAFCTLGPLSSQQNPITLVPTLVASQPAVSKQVLPFSWVVTTQGLIPLTLVRVPRPGEPPSAPGAALNQNPVEAAAPGNALARSVIPAETGPQVPPPKAQTPLTFSSNSQCIVVSPSLNSFPAASALLPSTGLAESQSRPISCLPVPQNPVSGTSPHPNLAKESSAPPAQPAAVAEEKVTPDYSLITLEAESAVNDWVKGVLTISNPMGDTNLPYLPPFLCSLRTLSALLTNKETLEQSAASLTMSGLPRGESGQTYSDELRAAVHQRLKDNPAYQLLRARFLAALTFPAALAALPPSMVITTLSNNHRDDTSMSEEEEEGSTEATSTSWTKEEPSTDSGDSDHLSETRVRRSTRLRKRRRKRRWQL